MENLYLIHRTSGRPFPSREDLLVWSTCLRQIAFSLSEVDPHILECSDQVLQGPEALAFLLEVICGLHSPLIGETEVQGQYRRFLAEFEKTPKFSFQLLAQQFQKILAESKKIRDAHLRCIGNQTYGSLIRKMASDTKSVSMIGAGQLAQEILPYLSEISKVNLHVRDPKKAESLQDLRQDLQVHTLGSVDLSAQTVLVVAPVSDEFLLEQLKDTSVDLFIDLRGGKDLLPRKPFAKTAYSLGEFMNLLNEQNDLKEHQKQNALKAIAKWKNLLSSEMQIRPYGWEDLCV